MTIPKSAFGQEVMQVAAEREIYTQKELARRLPTDLIALRGYLTGRQPATLKFLYRLDKALNLSEQERHTLAQRFAWGERAA